MMLLRRLVPAPLLSVVLLALWLVLARAPTLGQLLIGLALAVIVPLLTTRIRVRPRVRRPLLVARYILRVGHDVIASNLRVAADIVLWRRRRPQARFVRVPLELRAPVGLASLAMVTTVVPGTVWSELASDRSAMLLHVWDVDDEPAFVAHFKARYEQPLREIFE